MVTSLSCSSSHPQQGLISASTDEKQEGKYKINQPFYFEGKSRTTIQPVYFSPGLEQATMTLSTPIKDKQGNLLGVLAGRLALGELSKIIEQRPSESRPEDTYLVNTFNFFVTEPRFGKGYALKKAVYTEGVEAGLSGKTGVGFYKDYRGNSVIGAYKWLPELKMLILTEIDQEEAFAPIVHLLWVIAGITLVISLAAGLLSVFFARTITRPIRRLAAGAEEIGKGNLEFRVGTAAKDEMGGLSRVLDQMTGNLKKITVSRNDLLKEIEKRKLAEETLKTTLVRQEAILSAVPDIIMEVDYNKVYTWANQPGLEFFGQDAVGKEAAFYFEGEQDIYQTVQPLFNGNEDIIYVESWQRRKDGQKRLLAWWCRVLKDNAGKVTGALSSARDITERKLAEEALRESRQRFHDTVKYLDEGYYSVTPNGFLLEHNLAFNRILGFDPDQDLKGIQLPEFWRNSDERKHYLAELINKGFIKNYLIKAKTIRGEDIVIIANSHIVKDENDRLVRIEGTFADFTEPKRAEETIMRERDFTQAAIDSLPGLFYLFDDQGRFLRWNKNFEKVSGYSAEEISHLSPLDLFGEPDKGPVGEAIQQVFLVGEAGVEAEFLSKNQTRTPCFFTGRLFRIDQKPCLIGMGIDITERKRVEEALRERDQELEKRNEELTRFIYAVSHDLKSPLVTIRTFLGYLEQDTMNRDEGRRDQDLAYIRNAADKMSQLLDELLDLSRIGRMIHPPVEAPLQTIVQEALDLVAGQIAERGVQVQVTGELVLLVGDRPRLVEVFQNLVDNAVKFMGDQPNPRVEIGVEEVGDELVLFVRDNGIGIDLQYRPKLFGLFEKLDPRSEGVGIGLALVQRIIEVHGGRIWVESKGPGQGATFRFTLAHTKRQSI